MEGNFSVSISVCCIASTVHAYLKLSYCVREAFKVRVYGHSVFRKRCDCFAGDHVSITDLRGD